MCLVNAIIADKQNIFSDKSYIESLKICEANSYGRIQIISESKESTPLVKLLHQVQKPVRW